MRYIGSALGAALLFSAVGGSADATEYLNIIDPANPTLTQALGINGSDTIVGYGNATAFDGIVLTLPPVPGNFTRENFPNPSPPPATFFTQVTGIDAGGDTVGFYVTNPAVGTTSGFAKAFGGSFFTVNRARGCPSRFVAVTPNQLSFLVQSRLHAHLLQPMADKPIYDAHSVSCGRIPAFQARISLTAARSKARLW